MSAIKGRAALLALWFLPDWMLPPSVREAAERQVYDGLTRAEWFDKSIREMQAVNARQAAEKGSTAG